MKTSLAITFLLIHTTIALGHCLAGPCPPDPRSLLEAASRASGRLWAARYHARFVQYKANDPYSTSSEGDIVAKRFDGPTSTLPVRTLMKLISKSGTTT